MKKINILFVAITCLLFACQDAPEGQNVEAGDSKAKVIPASENLTDVQLDLNSSVISWLGTKPTGTHSGSLKLKSGGLTIDGTGKLVGGNFVIDMTTLKGLDQDEEGNTELAAHLMNEDFFDVTKFPTAALEITEVTPATEEGFTHNISANLTIKGQTHGITFGANVRKGHTLSAMAEIIIDRTQWGVHYGSDKSLGDRFIYPEIKIGVLLNEVHNHAH